MQPVLARQQRGVARPVLRRYRRVPVARLVGVPDVHPEFGRVVRRPVNAARRAYRQRRQHQHAVPYQAVQAHLGECPHIGERDRRVLKPFQLRHAVLYLRHKLRRNLNARGLRQVVHEQRQIRRRAHDAVVFHYRLVRLPVEERRHAADRLVADFGGVFGELGGALGRRRAHVHNVLDAPPVLVRGDFGDTHILFVGQQHALARAARRPKPVNPRPYVMLHHIAERRLVQLALRRHRRDDSRQYPLKVRH